MSRDVLTPKAVAERWHCSVRTVSRTTDSDYRKHLRAQYELGQQGLKREDAAALLRISVQEFDAQVELGRLPRPFCVSRKMLRWERQRLIREWEAWLKSRPGNIYFVGFLEYVKIGYAIAVPERVKELQTACPVPLVLYAAIEGYRETEAELHRRFAEYRLNGEWFRHEGELAAFIKAGAKE